MSFWPEEMQTDTYSIAECQSVHTAHYVPTYLRIATVFDTITDGFSKSKLYGALKNQ